MEVKVSISESEMADLLRLLDIIARTGRTNKLGRQDAQRVLDSIRAGMPKEEEEDITSLTPVPDYYSEQYNYERFPAKVNGRSGHFAVWSRDVARPNPEHVTWSPTTAVLVSEAYQNEAWHAERAERAARPDVKVGDIVRLGKVVIMVPKRAAEYVDGVPCQVLGEEA